MSRRRGNDYENEFCEQAEALGYCAFPARGSRGVVDVLCFQAEAKEVQVARYWVRGVYQGCEFLLNAPLAVQVGTTAKPINATLDELDKAPRPIGSLCIVARRIRAKNRRISWKYHTRAGTFSSLADAIEKRTE